jgi:hypothetical protein
LELEYKIVYKKGLENGVANALSRRPDDTLDCNHISCNNPQWLT